MLQQTQVVTVIPYYRRFMERFPTLASLAAASEDEVLSLWSGLGYYARGRNLLKAAQVISTEFSGHFPATIDTLNQLPGIGRSTAAAILALTWDQHHAILDGNVKRVLARFHMVNGWPGASSVEQQLWQLAEQHTPSHRCGDYTQAIMDLGATVCRRSRPSCELCPLQTDCRAHLNDCTADYPAAKPKKQRRERQTHMLVITRDETEILLERRPPTGIWGGLWCLPELPELPDPISRWAAQQFGVKIKFQRSLASVKHSFSHFDLTIKPLVYQAIDSGQLVMDNPDQLWYNALPATDIGVSAAVKKIIDAYFRE